MTVSQPRSDVHPDLPALARDIMNRVRYHDFPGFPAATAAQRQVLALADHAGAAVGAYRRYSGQGRYAGRYEDVGAHLADVIIAAYVAAAALRMDLDPHLASAALIWRMHTPV